METDDDMMTPEDQAYWDGMPEETPGVPSPADNLAQALLAKHGLARGLAELPLIPGTAIGTLVELAEATILADKVITF